MCHWRKNEKFSVSMFTEGELLNTKIAPPMDPSWWSLSQSMPVGTSRFYDEPLVDPEIWWPLRIWMDNWTEIWLFETKVTVYSFPIAIINWGQISTNDRNSRLCQSVLCKFCKNLEAIPFLRSVSEEGIMKTSCKDNFELKQEIKRIIFEILFDVLKLPLENLFYT